MNVNAGACQLSLLRADAALLQPVRTLTVGALMRLKLESWSEKKRFRRRFSAQCRTFSLTTLGLRRLGEHEKVLAELA